MRYKLPVIVLVLILISSAAAQTSMQSQKFEPTVGQPGKDVIWVPTPEALIEAMLDMAKVTPEDYLIDLGSGDGRIAIAAAKRGVRALGIEYNPDMVNLSKENAQIAGVADKAAFLNGDIFETDFRKATVLTMYLLPSLNLRLRPTILDMKPGTRVASHAFTMDDWEPDQTVEVEYRTAYLWIVPAKVEGTWSWSAGGKDVELELRQTFQKIEGRLIAGGREFPVDNAHLEADRISFTVDETATETRSYSGRVSGKAIQGTAKGSNGKAAEWTAALKPPR